jgi:anaerobic magnesium-protoporphyrin IX monomethyl ester cyclase
MEKKGRVLLMAPNMNGMPNGINRILPAHGIASLGGRIRDQGHELQIRDTALEGYDNHTPNPDGVTISIGEGDEEIYKFIEGYNPEYIAVSVLFSNNAKHGRNIARIAKEVNPGIVTMIGGNHINHTHREVIRDPNIDFIIRGECDFTLEQLISDHKNGRDVSKVPGIVYRQNGDIFEGTPGDRVGMIGNKSMNKYALDVLPDESRELMNIEKYHEINLGHNPKTSRKVGSIIATRGCPEICTFCTTPEMFGRTVRWRSPQKLFEEMVMLKEVYDIEEIQFEDDTLTAHRTNLKDLCNLMIDNNFGLPWCTPNGIKVNYPPNQGMQLEMFGRMAESGCYQVTLAVESGNQSILDNLVMKNLPLETVRPAVENAKSVGMYVHTYFIVGFPGETYEEMEETVKFAADIKADSYSLSILCPLPGTPIYDIARGRTPNGTYIKGPHVEAMLKITGGKNYMREGIGYEDILLTRSNIEVPGFSSAQEFEAWVDKKNIYLNDILRKEEPKRFMAYHGITDPRVLDTMGDKLLGKQT